MDQSEFLDHIDKRKFQLLVEELSKHVSGTSSETLKRLILKYHSNLLLRNVDQEVQVQIDGISLSQYYYMQS